MQFGTLVAQTVNYESRSPGVYTKAGVTFGQPDDSFILRGAGKTEPLRCSASRVKQKDIVVGADTRRKTCTVTLSVVVPSSDFTPAELDSMATDLAEVITPTFISQMLQGKS